MTIVERDGIGKYLLAGAVLLLLVSLLFVSKGYKEREEALTNSPVYEGIVQGKDIETTEVLNTALFAATNVYQLDEEHDYIIEVENQKVEIQKNAWEQFNVGDKVRFQKYQNGRIGNLTLDVEN